MSKLVLKPQRKLRKMVTSRDPTDMCSGAEEEHHGDRANARGGEDKPAAEKLRGPLHQGRPLPRLRISLRRCSERFCEWNLKNWCLVRVPGVVRQCFPERNCSFLHFMGQLFPQFVCIRVCRKLEPCTGGVWFIGWLVGVCVCVCVCVRVCVCLCVCVCDMSPGLS